MLSVIMLNVVILSVVMLSVVAHSTRDVYNKYFNARIHAQVVKPSVCHY